jgi:hypothetical protein
VRRHMPLILAVALAVAPPAHSGTFTEGSIAPEQGVGRLTRGAAQQQVGRSVFSSPYATVTLSNVDLYDRFPYVEARNFQIVSDPAWNRIVCGEVGHGLMAFDGSGTAVGPLSGPRGMAVDERNRLYVADTNNDRIVVLQANTEFDQITLTPLFTVDGLRGPYDVAYSDGGTPFAYGDDVLYVADTGRNRVAAYALGENAASPVASIGDLGSGVGAFAGPMAVAAGRVNGVNTPDVYVADAHNRRIVRLRLVPGALRWVGEAAALADVVTSLDTDHWGNVYAAAPQQGVVRKLNADLESVADLRGAIARPRSFRVPFSTIRDHRDGSARRQGQPSALSIDQWSDESGMVLWTLGVSIDALHVVGGDAPVAHFTLTDPSTLTLKVSATADGRRVSTRSLGVLGAGAHDIPLTAEDLRGVGSSADLVLTVSAVSGYSGGSGATAQTGFRASGSGAVVLPTSPQLIGNWPNPVHGSTRIALALPRDAAAGARLGVFDTQGRLVRSLQGPFVAGLNEVSWDANDAEGHAAKAGLYFYRLDSGRLSLSRRLVVIR